MKHRAIKAAFVCLAISLSLPSLADRDHHQRHHHRDHHHRHGYDSYGYASGYADPGCRVEGWYDRGGYYHERQVCRGARVGMPFPPPPPAVFLQPPSVIIQPPGVYFR
jgi:hypothetical protein